MATLQNSRPANEKYGQKAMVWETSDQDTLTALNKTKESMNRGYDLTDNNCTQVIADGVNEVGGYMSRSMSPGGAVTNTLLANLNPFLNPKYTVKVKRVEE